MHSIFKLSILSGILMVSIFNLKNSEAAMETWTYCASEGGTCKFMGTRKVRYGTKLKFITKIFTNQVTCSNLKFGDPAIGKRKSCSYSSLVVANVVVPPVVTVPPAVNEPTVRTDSLILPMVELTYPKEHSFNSFIYSTNFNAFRVKGICSDGVITINYAGKIVNLNCVNKEWSAHLDFSGVPDGEWGVDVSIVNSIGKTNGTKRNFVKNQAGRQIYVNGDSGNNSNSGSEIHPYLDFWKAIEEANAGDVIRLVPRANGASYPNLYIADKAGLPNKLITIMGSNELVKTQIIPPSSDVQSVHIVRSSYIAIRNLDIQNPVHNCVAIDGTNTNTGFRPSHHIEVTDNFIHDCGENGIG